MSRIADIYFYCELLHSIGPKESNEWLQTCVLEKSEMNATTSRAKSPSNRSLKSLNSTLSASSAEQTTEIDLNICTRVHSAEGMISIEKSAEAHKKVQYLEASLNADGINGINDDRDSINDDRESIPSDSYSFSESPTNLGLLYTDAAHIVLNKLPNIRSLKGIRKFRSSFF
jgi:hypothetical protein